MTKEIIQFRDGTSQRDRTPVALDPGYVSVDQRGARELLIYAKKIAGYIKYYDESNRVAGNWTGLFDFTDEELSEILRILDDPDSFNPHDDKLKRFSRPHFILFLTFLKLLRHPQRQFNELTGRHLDFYYRNVLHLKEKPGTADRVHVLFELEPDIEEHRLEKGILLNAGTDSEGKDLIYALEDEIVVNHARVSQIRIMRVLKNIIGLKQIHERYQRSDKGIEKVLRRALGDPDQDNPLPFYPEADGSETIADITFIKERLFPLVEDKKDEELTDKEKIYLLDQLCFVVIEDFREVMTVHNREINKGERGSKAPTDAEWNHVYELIEKANRKKVTLKRRRNLQEIHSQEGFELMIKFALGDPQPGADLPMIEGTNSLDLLLDAVGKPEADAKFRQHIEEHFFMTVDNFKTIMSIKNAQESTGAQLSASDGSWDEAYRLLEKASARKRQFKFQPLYRQKTTGIVSLTALSKGIVSDAASVRFNAFGPEENSIDLDYDLNESNQIGFAVSSPLFELREGQREITINLVCDANGFYEESLNEILRKDPLPYDLWISGAEQWLQADRVEFEVGGFVLQEELKTYENDLKLVCSSDLGKIDKKNKFIRLEDGYLYEIVKIDSQKRIVVRSLGKKSPKAGIRLYQEMDLESPTPVETVLTYDKEKKIVSAKQEIFHINDKDRYIKLVEGVIVQVKQFVNAKTVEVLYRGLATKRNKKSQISNDIKLSASTMFPSGLSLSSIVSTGGKTEFEEKDLNRLILWENGKVFSVIAKSKNSEVKVKEIGSLNRFGKIQKYKESAICFNTLQFKIKLDDKAPALTTIGSIEENTPTKQPTIKMLLKQPSSEKESSNYESFKSLQIHSIVAVVQAKGISELKIRNDFALLDPKTPFEPFGTEPQIGSGFYFYQDEVCTKKLDRLTLELDWMGLPDNFSDYYDSYYENDDDPRVDRKDFKTQLMLFDARSWRDIGGHRGLFDLNKDPALEFDFEGYKVKSIPEEINDDPLEMFRYFKLELREKDFFHQQYSIAMNKISLHNAKVLANKTGTERNSPNPPYTPKVKSVFLDYTASTRLELSDSSLIRHDIAQDDLTFSRIHPFGSEVVHKINTLLPSFDQEGYLHIGLEGIKPLQNISLLFQLAPGSGNPELNVPAVTWECLSQSGWSALKEVELLSDSSNGLIDTGIIKLTMPETASSHNSLMPEGLHWLRASVKENASAISNIISIHSQAVEAVFSDKNNATEHLNHPLAEATITGLVEDNPAIVSVHQPYSSFKGRAFEEKNQYYTRVSERLRHRQRAVTAWDYERLVLEAFPEVYKAKCLTSSDLKNMPESSADLVVVVIPDISNTAPFFPLEPKAPLYLLKEIESYLGAFSSPFINLKVQNPKYEQIRYRVTVRFKQGSDQGYYLKQLNEDLKQFLSPWAYQEQADIPFGSSLHSSAVIHFIEKRPYVDYVAMLKLIEHRSGDIFEPKLFGLSDRTNLARVRSPDAILVSAPEHIIDLITKDDYEEEDFEGIGYMIIGTDFKISPPDPEFKTLGYMKIGGNFQIY